MDMSNSDYDAYGVLYKCKQDFKNLEEKGGSFKATF